MLSPLMASMITFSFLMPLRLNHNRHHDISLAKPLGRREVIKLVNKEEGEGYIRLACPLFPWRMSKLPTNEAGEQRKRV